MRIANTSPFDADYREWTVESSGAEFARTHPREVARVLLGMADDEASTTSERLLALAALAMLFESCESERQQKIDAVK